MQTNDELFGKLIQAALNQLDASGLRKTLEDGVRVLSDEIINLVKSNGTPASDTQRSEPSAASTADAKSGSEKSRIDDFWFYDVEASNSKSLWHGCGTCMVNNSWRLYDPEAKCPRCGGPYQVQDGYRPALVAAMQSRDELASRHEKIMALMSRLEDAVNEGVSDEIIKAAQILVDNYRER
jgi:hypothetical protein